MSDIRIVTKNLEQAKRWEDAQVINQDYPAQVCSYFDGFPTPVRHMHPTASYHTLLDPPFAVDICHMNEFESGQGRLIATRTIVDVHKAEDCWRMDPDAYPYANGEEWCYPEAIPGKYHWVTK